ncbi:5'/3'-nucleotidase sure [Thozetella sp. PMI_491]|nr:5'/3'-nucleotidase sure [Thozetella sp. PMI_491]
MKLLSQVSLGFAAIAVPTQALNILVNNDDSWGSANIRETYRLLRAAGHNAWMVAPANAQSGTGGTLVMSTTANLSKSSLWGILPAGAPSLGHDANDDHMWYYDGSPQACTLVGLDYVIPTFANFTTPDLIVSGPNFGDNVGTYAFTGSGTIGAAYTAVMRGIPAIAVSAPNSALSFRDIVNQTDADATKYGRLTTTLVNRLAERTCGRSSVLPVGYGLNINYLTLNDSCTDPEVVFSRFGGGAGMPKLAYNASTGVFGIANNDYFSVHSEGLNVCLNGDCSREGESVVVQSCRVAVSIFTADFDAPNTPVTQGVVAKFSD